MEKLRVGIVGLGYWGPKLVESFRGMAGAEVTQVCDLNPQLLGEIAQKYNLAGTTSFAELLADQTEAVAIATPPSTHAVLVRQALEAGKHVFIEKPLATDFDEARSLAELAKSKNLVLFVDHTFCYDEAFGRVRELVQNGDLGKIQKASFEWLGARPKPRGPDVLWDSGPHAVAAMNFVMNQSATLISAEVLARLETGVPSALSAKFTFPGGSKADVLLAWKDQEIDGSPVPKAARVVLSGDKELVFEGSFGARAVSVRENGVAHPLAGLTFADEPLKSALGAFVDAVKYGKKIPSDGKFGAEVVKILEMTAKSAGLV